MLNWTHVKSMVYLGSGICSVGLNEIIICVCVCVWRLKQWWPPSVQPFLLQYNWHMVHMCANTHAISHSHTNTHVLTFSNIKKTKQNYTKYSERWRGKNDPCCEQRAATSGARWKLMLTLITENKRVFQCLSIATGLADVIHLTIALILNSSLYKVRLPWL